MDETTKYPNVKCHDHPGREEPGYMICKHINSKEDIAHVEPPDEENLGVLCCASCFEKREDDGYTLENFILACAPGIRERGWDLSFNDDKCEACGKNTANRECGHGILCDECDEQVHGKIGGTCEYFQ